MESRGTVLTPAEAAVVTGYTAGHPGCLVREGIIPNAGWPGVSGIARGELGRKGRLPAPGRKTRPSWRELPDARLLRSITERGGWWHADREMGGSVLGPVGGASRARLPPLALEARGVVPRPGVQPWPAAGFLRSSTSPGGLTRKP